jgi:hypothetical protein
MCVRHRYDLSGIKRIDVLVIAGLRLIELGHSITNLPSRSDLQGLVQEIKAEEVLRLSDVTLFLQKGVEMVEVIEKALLLFSVLDPAPELEDILC